MKHTRVAALAAASLLVPLAALAPSAVAADAGVTAAAEAPYSAIATTEVTGAQATAPSALSWQSPTNAFTLTGDAQAFTLNTGDTASVVVTADAGVPLALGAVALGPENTADTKPSLRLTGGGLDLAAQSGTMTITELTVTEGAITAFAADVTASFGEGTGSPERTVALRYNSANTYQGLSSTGPLALGTAKLGYPTAAQPITVTVTGPTAVTFGTTVPVERSTGDKKKATIEITNDTCAGQVVEPGASCTITVVGRPQSLVAHDDLVLVQDSAGTVLVGERTTVTGVMDRAGRYHSVAPKRAYDSRSTNSPLGTGSDRVVKVAGVAGVPATARAVVVNVTAVTPSANGYLAVHTAAGTPTTSNVNFKKGVTRANLVTTPMAADGTIRVYNKQGTTHLIVDVVGWVNPGYTCACIAGSQYEPTDPLRVLDTRTANDGPAFAPGEEVPITMSVGEAGSDASVTGVVVNLTAVSPTRAGHLLAWDGASAAPNVSNLNFLAGQTVPGLAFVPVRQTANGFSFTIRNGSSGTTHVLADVVGYFDKDSVSGLRFVNAPTTRVLDTRDGTGGVGVGMIGPVTTKTVTVPDAAWNTVDTVALMTNVTAAWSTKATHEIVWANNDGSPRPAVSNLNPVANDLVSNAVLTELTYTSPSTFWVYNNAGSTHLIADVMGVWNAYPGADAFPAAASAKSGAASASESLTTRERLANGPTLHVVSTR